MVNRRAHGFGLCAKNLAPSHKINNQRCVSVILFRRCPRGAHSGDPRELSRDPLELSGDYLDGSGDPRELSGDYLDGSEGPRELSGDYLDGSEGPRRYAVGPREHAGGR